MGILCCILLSLRAAVDGASSVCDECPKLRTELLMLRSQMHSVKLELSAATALNSRLTADIRRYVLVKQQNFAIFDSLMSEAMGASVHSKWIYSSFKSNRDMVIALYCLSNTCKHTIVNLQQILRTFESHSHCILQNSVPVYRIQNCLLYLKI